MKSSKKVCKVNDIKVLQQHLKDLGYFENEDTTTYYGDITKNAVMNFQQAKGLDEDGIFGGTSASGFDCSGYTSFVYAQNGISLPRTSEAQAQAGTKIDKTNIQIGDLLIFSNTYKSGPSHAGIYLGNNQFIHASSTGKGVIISELDNYYSNHLSYGRRVY